MADNPQPQYEKILFCTVGGSHEPILKAIGSAEADFIVFICSEDDPVTRQSGSYTQIEGKGKCIKAKPQDQNPTLPNIPTQARLPEDSWETIRIPPDNLSESFKRITQCIRGFITEQAQARVICDYTGGTKTMAAALVLSVGEIDCNQIELQLVTGPRADLRVVPSGTEEATVVDLEAFRQEKHLRYAARFWKKYAYGEAAQYLDALPPTGHDQAKQLRSAMRNLSKAFAAWDCFDFATAANLLQPYQSQIARIDRLFLDVIGKLNDNGHALHHIHCVWDVWLNAERCAVRGRYDDAVARIYRFLEGVAQWQMQERLGYSSNAVPRAHVDPQWIQSDNENPETMKLPLVKSWTHLNQRQATELSKRVIENINELNNLLTLRNNSILAHGWSPVSQAQYQEFHDWVAQYILPELKKEMQGKRIRTLPPQLPDTYPESLLELRAPGG